MINQPPIQEPMYKDAARPFLSPLWVLWFQFITSMLNGIFGIGTAPASATATGAKGEVRFCSDAIYVCVAENVWKKIAIATF